MSDPSAEPFAVRSERDWEVGADLTALAWLAATWAGALAGGAGGRLWPSVGLMIVAVFGVGLFLAKARSPLTIVPLFLLGGLLMSDAVRAYERSLTDGSFNGEAMVVGDPSPVGTGWVVELRLDDRRRVEAVAFGATGTDLSRL